MNIDVPGNKINGVYESALNQPLKITVRNTNEDKDAQATPTVVDKLFSIFNLRFRIKIRILKMKGIFISLSCLDGSAMGIYTCMLPQSRP